jgi:hypothetical protein
MPLISISQLLDKTFYVTKKVPIFRVNDLNKYGDKAKKVGFLNPDYFFVLDSYIAPKESGVDKYYLQYAKLSNYYFTFRGNDGGYYGVKYVNDGRFSLKALQQQGVKTIEEQKKEQEEKEKTPVEKATEKITDIFTGAGKTFKTLLYIGAGVFAVGYLLPKILKK